LNQPTILNRRSDPVNRYIISHLFKPTIIVYILDIFVAKFA